jgi:serine/tyrosine/threonine adenylyltransferase
LTIDYGPYGWIDDFDPNWTPNTTDAAGRRYRFGAQEQISYWNVARFGEALVPVMPSVDPLHAGMERFVAELSRVSQLTIAAKLGLRRCEEDDVPLMHDLQKLLYAAEVDMTIFFRRLAALDIDAPSLEPFENAFYDAGKRRDHEGGFAAWLTRYAQRVRRDRRESDEPERRARMNAANPRYVLRNFLAQQAIDRAEQGDYTAIHELLEVLRRPYDDQPDGGAYDQRRPDWARDRAGCSMLSCSS